MPSKLELTSKLAPDTHQVNFLKAGCLNLFPPKLSDLINKNTIVSKYNASCCQEKGIDCKVTPVKKGEPYITSTKYPTIYQLVQGCSIKPSLDHQCRVADLIIDIIIVVLLKSTESYRTDKDFENLAKVNSLYQEMIHNIVEFRILDVSKL
jgi:hypothetical protein